jgi:ceramide glucosyltransferase
MFFLQVIIGVLLIGSWTYSVMTVVAVYRYLKRRPRLLRREVAVSVLKPLSGIEEDLETNLRSFFRQDYKEFEIIFAVRHSDDLALDIVHRLEKEFPSIPCRILATGESPYPNAKVYSLDKMIKASRHDLLVMSDSDIRVEQDMLKVVVAEFEDEKIDLVTCPYRAVPSHSFWSRLEAIGLNTEFLAGLLVARLVEGVRFAVGPTIVVRKKLIEDLGGFSRFGSYLAEDFALGRLASEQGYGVELSYYRVDHYIAGRARNGNRARCCGEWIDNVKHRLRWARSTRCSRRWGYLGQAFTYPLPWSLVAAAMLPWETMELLGLTALLRAVAVWAVAWAVLHDSLTRWNFWLVPLQDLMGWILWFFGFFGNRIEWRDRAYRLLADGRFELIEK